MTVCKLSWCRDILYIIMKTFIARVFNIVKFVWMHDTTNNKGCLQIKLAQTVRLLYLL